MRLLDALAEAATRQPTTLYRVYNESLGIASAPVRWRLIHPEVHLRCGPLPTAPDGPITYSAVRTRIGIPSQSPSLCHAPRLDDILAWLAHELPHTLESDAWRLEHRPWRVEVTSALSQVRLTAPLSAALG